MHRILLFLFLILTLSACGSDDDIEIRYSGQVNGEFEAQGHITCFDRNKVPFLGFRASKEDNYDQVTIYLVPGITTGNYQFTNGNIEGDGILFRAFLGGDSSVVLSFEDLISGKLTLTQLPNEDGGWVEGEFDVIYRNTTIEETFKYRADPDDAPFDCVN